MITNEIRSRTAWGRLLATGIVGSALAFGAGSAAASIPDYSSDGNIVPETISGNPSCATLGYQYGIKFEPQTKDQNGLKYNFTRAIVEDSQFKALKSDQFPHPDLPGAPAVPDLPGHTITVSSADDKHFAWSSTTPVAVVIAKGGPNANAYLYTMTDLALGDSGLRAPNVGPGNTPDLSHIDFCFVEQEEQEEEEEEEEQEEQEEQETPQTPQTPQTPKTPQQQTTPPPAPLAPAPQAEVPVTQTGVITPVVMQSPRAVRANQVRPSLTRLGISKVGPRRAMAGQRFTYTIRVRNGGRNVARNVILRDALPTGLVRVNTSMRATQRGRVLTIRLGHMRPGQMRTVRVTVRAAQAIGGQRVNIAVARAANARPVRATAPTLIRPVVRRIAPAVTG